MTEEEMLPKFAGTYQTYQRIYSFDENLKYNTKKIISKEELNPYFFSYEYIFFFNFHKKYICHLKFFVQYTVLLVSVYSSFHKEGSMKNGTVKKFFLL